MVRHRDVYKPDSLPPGLCLDGCADKSAAEITANN